MVVWKGKAFLNAFDCDRVGVVAWFILIFHPNVKMS